MATPTTGFLVENFFNGISGFFWETGNMVYNLKQYKEMGKNEKIWEVFLADC